MEFCKSTCAALHSSLHVCNSACSSVDFVLHSSTCCITRFNAKPITALRPYPENPFTACFFYMAIVTEKFFFIWTLALLIAKHQFSCVLFLDIFLSMLRLDWVRSWPCGQAVSSQYSFHDACQMNILSRSPLKILTLCFCCQINMVVFRACVKRLILLTNEWTVFSETKKHFSCFYPSQVSQKVSVAWEVKTCATLPLNWSYLLWRQAMSLCVALPVKRWVGWLKSLMTPDSLPRLPSCVLTSKQFIGMSYF